MSEKRFTFYAEKTGQHYEISIRDEKEIKEYNITDDFFKSKDITKEVVDLLNELSDENERHREEIINSHIAYVECLNEIKDLKEENEQLKSDVEYWKNKAMILVKQMRIMTTRMTEAEIKEFNKELKDD